MNIVIKKVINWLHIKKINHAAETKLKQIKKNMMKTDISIELEREYCQLWKRLGVKPSLTFIKYMCTLSGIESSQYVPENIHYGLIEPVLNNRAYALIFNDKNFYERYLKNYEHLFPEAILRGINGSFFSYDYRHILKQDCIKILENIEDLQNLVLKPASETGGGNDVRFFQKVKNGFIENNQEHSFGEFLDILEKKYKMNFILQKRIFQLPWFSKFNESSLNTIRLYTYRSVKNEQVHPLHAYLRFGNKGSSVDSSSQGGRTCGIFLDGSINDFALGRYGEKYYDIKCLKENQGSLVPQFEKMKEIASELGKLFPYHRLLGFDFTVDKNDNIRLFEVNNLFIGVINQQMNTGPLFGKFTDEVIDYCLNNKKSIAFHYYL